MSSAPARRIAVALLFGGAALVRTQGASADPSAPATAASSCPIRLVPETAAKPWREAVEKAAARLAGLAPPHDCRSVEVIVGPEGRATLAFLTTDGRGAARALETPADLRPTLEALLVTLPSPRSTPGQAPSGQAPSGQAPSGQAPSGQAGSTPLQNTAPPLDEAPPPRAKPVVEAPPDAAGPPSSVFPQAGRSEIHLLAGASAGARFVGSGGAFGSPGFTLQASVVVERWELGLVADYAPVYLALGQAAPAGFWLWSLSTGLALGRRDPAGPVALSYGLALAVQSLSEGAPELAGTKAPRSLDVAHPRAGAYGKVVYPARARARFTTGIEADAVLSHLPDNGARDRQLPAMPRFGLSLSFGVEAAIL